MIITGARDVKTYLDNFGRRPGIDWSNPFHYHVALIFQVILDIKKDCRNTRKVKQSFFD